MGSALDTDKKPTVDSGTSMGTGTLDRRKVAQESYATSYCDDDQMILQLANQEEHTLENDYINDDCKVNTNMNNSVHIKNVENNNKSRQHTDLNSSLSGNMEDSDTIVSTQEKVDTNMNTCTHYKKEDSIYDLESESDGNVYDIEDITLAIADSDDHDPELSNDTRSNDTRNNDTRSIDTKSIASDDTLISVRTVTTIASWVDSKCYGVSAASSKKNYTIDKKNNSVESSIINNDTCEDERGTDGCSPDDIDFTDDSDCDDDSNSDGDDNSSTSSSDGTDECLCPTQNSNSGWSRCACGFCDNAAVSQSAFVVLTMQSFSGDNHQNAASLNGNNSSSVGWSHGGYSHQHPAHLDQTVAQKYQPSVYTEPQNIEVVDVYLYVDPHHNRYARYATLCEHLFGIVAGNFASGYKLSGSNGKKRDTRILIEAVLPGSEAAKSREIHIGDWLMSVNDLDVTWDNIESILSAITKPNEIKLTIQKFDHETYNPEPIVPPDLLSSVNHDDLNHSHQGAYKGEGIIKLISGDRLQLQAQRPNIASVPHVAMYLTLAVETAHKGQKDDVLYQYPSKDSKLIDIRGLFITMCHVVKDVTNNNVSNSTLVVGGHLVHIVYIIEDKDVLVLGMPANKISISELNEVAADVLRTMKVTYGSLHNAFTDGTSRADDFFRTLFERCLLTDELLSHGLCRTTYLEPMFDIIPAVRLLTLPEETKSNVNRYLSELEAADFADMADDYYGLRRCYSLLGSCLFYKGYLLGSHLCKQHLQDITLYLRYHSFLTLCNEEQFSKRVAWTEFFPTEYCHDKKIQSESTGYSAPKNCRWFLLAVSLKNSVLAVLLEAGGCAQLAQGNPSVDPFYVQHLTATLQQLESEDLHYQCEVRLQSPSIPTLASADWFSGKHTKDHQTLVNTSQTVSPQKSQQTDSILKKIASSPIVDKTRTFGRNISIFDMESESDSHSTGTSEGSTPGIDWKTARSTGSEGTGDGSHGSVMFKGSRRRRNMLSAYNMSGLQQSLGDVGSADGGCFVKLTNGCDNLLFHYVHIDDVEGVYICPSQQEISQVNGPVHSQLLHHFQKACLHIRRVFDRAKPTNTSSFFHEDSILAPTQEHGLMFQMPINSSDSKKQQYFTYWVVGRILPKPYPRQFYVCFQDSAVQNVVELAFKLAFGVTV